MTIGKPVWWLTKDGDLDLLKAYEGHYSAYKYRDGRKRTQCFGPGECIVLRTLDALAFWGWRKFIDDCINIDTGERQTGVNNNIFANHSKGKYLSSELVRQG
jgi:hypothetical protein